jgi:hypothetical protein
MRIRGRGDAQKVSRKACRSWFRMPVMTVDLHTFLVALSTLVDELISAARGARAAEAPWVSAGGDRTARGSRWCDVEAVPSVTPSRSPSYQRPWRDHDRPATPPNSTVPGGTNPFLAPSPSSQHPIGGGTGAIWYHAVPQTTAPVPARCHRGATCVVVPRGENAHAVRGAVHASHAKRVGLAGARGSAAVWKAESSSNRYRAAR